MWICYKILLRLLLAVSVLGAGLRTSHTRFHFTLSRGTQWWGLPYSHFIDKDTGLREFRVLPKVTQLVHDRAGV